MTHFPAARYSCFVTLELDGAFTSQLHAENERFSQSVLDLYEAHLSSLSNGHVIPRATQEEVPAYAVLSGLSRVPLKARLSIIVSYSTRPIFFLRITSGALKCFIT